jgi:WhiB family redox-sensing transcriptional regulator
MTRPSWKLHAACRGTNPALFYDPHPDAVAAAKAVCATCAVRAACAETARTNGEAYGVWGGLADHERPTPASPRQTSTGLRARRN